jgi:hypothetical protein
VKEQKRLEAEFVVGKKRPTFNLFGHGKGRLAKAAARRRSRRGEDDEDDDNTLRYALMAAAGLAGAAGLYWAYKNPEVVSRAVSFFGVSPREVASNGEVPAVPRSQQGRDANGLPEVLPQELRDELAPHLETFGGVRSFPELDGLPPEQAIRTANYWLRSAQTYSQVSEHGRRQGWNPDTIHRAWTIHESNVAPQINAAIAESPEMRRAIGTYRGSAVLGLPYVTTEHREKLSPDDPSYESALLADLAISAVIQARVELERMRENPEHPPTALGTAGRGIAGLFGDEAFSPDFDIIASLRDLNDVDSAEAADFLKAAYAADTLNAAARAPAFVSGAVANPLAGVREVLDRLSADANTEVGDLVNGIFAMQPDQISDIIRQIDPAMTSALREARLRETTDALFHTSEGRRAQRAQSAVSSDTPTRNADAFYSIPDWVDIPTTLLMRGRLAGNAQFYIAQMMPVIDRMIDRDPEKQVRRSGQIGLAQDERERLLAVGEITSAMESGDRGRAEQLLDSLLRRETPDVVAQAGETTANANFNTAMENWSANLSGLVSRGYLPPVHFMALMQLGGAGYQRIAYADELRQQNGGELPSIWSIAANPETLEPTAKWLANQTYWRHLGDTRGAHRAIGSIARGVGGDALAMGASTLESAGRLTRMPAAWREGLRNFAQRVSSSGMRTVTGVGSTGALGPAATGATTTVPQTAGRLRGILSRVGEAGKAMVTAPAGQTSFQVLSRPGVQNAIGRAPGGGFINAASKSRFVAGMRNFAGNIGATTVITTGAEAAFDLIRAGIDPDAYADRTMERIARYTVMHEGDRPGFWGTIRTPFSALWAGMDEIAGKTGLSAGKANYTNNDGRPTTLAGEGYKRGIDLLYAGRMTQATTDAANEIVQTDPMIRLMPPDMQARIQSHISESLRESFWPQVRIDHQRNGATEVSVNTHLTPDTIRADVDGLRRWVRNSAPSRHTIDPMEALSDPTGMTLASHSAEWVRRVVNGPRRAEEGEQLEGDLLRDALVGFVDAEVERDPMMAIRLQNQVAAMASSSNTDLRDIASAHYRAYGRHRRVLEHMMESHPDFRHLPSERKAEFITRAQSAYEARVVDHITTAREQGVEWASFNDPNHALSLDRFDEHAPWRKYWADNRHTLAVPGVDRDPVDWRSEHDFRDEFLAAQNGVSTQGGRGSKRLGPLDARRDPLSRMSSTQDFHTLSDAMSQTLPHDLWEELNSPEITTLIDQTSGMTPPQRWVDRTVAQVERERERLTAQMAALGLTPETERRQQQLQAYGRGQSVLGEPRDARGSARYMEQPVISLRNSGDADTHPQTKALTHLSPDEAQQLTAFIASLQDPAQRDARFFAEREGGEPAVRAAMSDFLRQHDYRYAEDFDPWSETTGSFVYAPDGTLVRELPGEDGSTRPVAWEDTRADILANPQRYSRFMSDRDMRVTVTPTSQPQQQARPTNQSSPWQGSYWDARGRQQGISGREAYDAWRQQTATPATPPPAQRPPPAPSPRTNPFRTPTPPAAGTSPTQPDVQTGTTATVPPAAPVG